MPPSFALASSGPLLKGWKPRSRPILFEASRRALLSAEVNILPNSVGRDIAAISCLCHVDTISITNSFHLRQVIRKVNSTSTSYLKMVEKQSPESAWSFSLGSTPSDAGSSVQVHADNGSTRTQSLSGTKRPLTPSVRDLTVDPVKERLSRTGPPSPSISSHSSEPPLRDDLLRDLIHSYDTHLVTTASVPVSHSRKRPHDGALTDTEPPAKRDRLIEELEQMAPTESKAAIESLPTRQKEINVPGDPVAFTRAETTIPTIEGHTRVILPIRSSTKRQTSRQQRRQTTALPEQHEHAETKSEQGT